MSISGRPSRFHGSTWRSQGYFRRIPGDHRSTSKGLRSDTRVSSACYGVLGAFHGFQRNFRGIPDSLKKVPGDFRGSHKLPEVSMRS